MSDATKKKNDYEVGYGKPPKHSRFKTGQSGNPKGRPKGANGVTACLRRELESRITIREENRELRVSKAEAIAKRLTAVALKGDMKALLALLKIDPEMLADNETRDSDSKQTFAPDPVDFEILRDYLASTSEAEEDIKEEEGDHDGS